MSQQPRCAGWTWLATAAIAGTFVLSTAACAPAVYSSRGQSVYSATPYDRLQQRSQQLEMLAARARDRARLDQGRGGRLEVTDRMDDFTKHAHDLRQLVRERVAAPLAKAQRGWASYQQNERAAVWPPHAASAALLHGPA
ncbi:MAG TPA: hypothetical protein VF332_11070 [Vicinamibacterales bacterium]